MKTLVLGVGNLLMGDEGVGIRVVRHLQVSGPVPGVTFADGGTGGLHLLGYFLEFERVILVDAVLDGRPPGTVAILRPVFGADYPRTLAAHDIGLKDVLDAAVLLEAKPEILLVTISVAAVDRTSLDLSPAASGAIERAATAVLEAIAAPSRFPPL